MKAARVRQKRMGALVAAIARHWAEHGYGPSVRELRAATGLSSISEVAHWLPICEQAGLIVRAPRLARAVRLTAAGRALAAEHAEAEPRSAGGGRAA